MSFKRIIFTRAFDDFDSKKLGVRRAHVERALQRSERADDISHMGGNFRLHLVRVTETTPQRLLLILEQLVADERKIMSALPVFQDLHPDIFSLSPLSVVGLLADRFGSEFTFGGQTTKFLREASGPVPPDGRFLTGNDDGRDFAMMGLMMIEGTPPKTVHLSMFWKLDTQRFLAWIRSQRTV